MIPSVRNRWPPAVCACFGSGLFVGGGSAAKATTLRVEAFPPRGPTQSFVASRNLPKSPLTIPTDKPFTLDLTLAN